MIIMFGSVDAKSVRERPYAIESGWIHQGLVWYRTTPTAGAGSNPYYLAADCVVYWTPTGNIPWTNGWRDVER